MSELDDVLAALEASGGRDVALATIVGVRGSTYRHEGARLVVPASGELVGNISGGCLEGDVADAAREVLASGRSRMLHFDLTADDEAVWGWGLGCNGAIDVLVEPAEAAARFAAVIREARRHHQPLALVTLVNGNRAGARLAVHASGAIDGSLGDHELDQRAAIAAGRALAAGRSTRVGLGGSVRAFIEVFEPPARLLVCGAGHDAVPLTEAGARLGWTVEVVDDRRTMLTAQRFPAAHRLVQAEPRQAAAVAGADGRSHVVVMSHNFLRDTAYLESFLGHRPAVAYLGVLGPRARLQRLLEAVAAAGTTVAPDALARVHGPAGLDIGAEEPAEIAWAIVAEILAVRRGATGGFLRDHAGPIHERREPEMATS